MPVYNFVKDRNLAGTLSPLLGACVLIGAIPDKRFKSSLSWLAVTSFAKSCRCQPVCIIDHAVADLFHSLCNRFRQLYIFRISVPKMWRQLREQKNGSGRDPIPIRISAKVPNLQPFLGLNGIDKVVIEFRRVFPRPRPGADVRICGTIETQLEV